MENYKALLDDYDDGRSSAESSEEFTFQSAMALRKNLTSAFDKQVAKPSTGSNITRSSCFRDEEETSSAVGSRIAQFEAAAASALAATKPPLPRQQQSNTIPSNRLAVYLRIRPIEAKKASVAAPKGATTNTIEVLKPKHPNIHPTSVRTYPPAQSNSSKIHSSNQSIQSEKNPLAPKQFDFHQVLKADTTQKTVYSMVASPLIQNAFDAAISTNNATVRDLKRRAPSRPPSALLFSYGITNAGKTHTILGNLKSTNDAEWGIVPRAISDVFDRINQMPKNAQFDLYISYFEIYNEQIFDLLPKSRVRKKHPFDSKKSFRYQETGMMGPPPSLKLRERQGQTIVRGLAKHKVQNVQHGIELTMAANHRRHTSSNNLNSDSSRSHCVCQMQLIPRASTSGGIEKASISSSQVEDDDASVISMSGYSTDEEASFYSKKMGPIISIVDLAGSERSKRTCSGTARQKEASQINMSLMRLMRCLTIIRESGRTTSGIIPFRESKLTHVFMGHFTGESASRTAMIVNVNPSVDDFDETQHVLSYASQAKLIHMDPEELKRKREQYYGPAMEEYDMNGRKKRQKTNNDTNSGTSRALVVAQPKPSKSGFGKLVKKLSPRKMMKKLSPKKKFGLNFAKKRKVVVRSKSGMSSVSSDTSSKPGSENALKRQRIDYPVERRNSPPSQHSSEQYESLRRELDSARAKIQKLEIERSKLLEELSQQEAQIRMEVCEEMEDRLRITRERNNEELERLRIQINANPLPLRSTRKAQLDQTEKLLEELMDKVDECEEEMIRMRQDNENAVSKLNEIHAKEIADLRAKSTKVSDNHALRQVADLQRELEASRKQVERLQASKMELVENYEKMLEDASQKQENGGSDFVDEEDDTENMVPSWKLKLTRSKKIKKNQSKRQPTSSPSRKPLGNMTSNLNFPSTENSSKLESSSERWVFPKKPSAKDNSGRYRRPSGRAPNGREWDAGVGAWKLPSVMPEY